MATSQRWGSSSHALPRLRTTLELLLDLRRDVESNIDPPMLLDRAFLALAPAVATKTAGAR